jgi:two-component system NarL family sensor kinase
MSAPFAFDLDAARGDHRRRAPRDEKMPAPATVHLDADGRIRDASDSAAAMLGYEPLALTGRSLSELAADGWREAAAVASAQVRFGSREDFALMLRGRSGRLSLIEMAVLPCVGAPGGASVAVLEWGSGRLRRESATGAIETQLRRLAYLLMQRRECERLDVAKRLHDDLAPTLAMAKYLVEDAALRSGQGSRDDAAELLGQAAANLRHVVAELRNISNGLRPRLLDDLGLLPALEWFCRGFEEAHPGIPVRRLFGATERTIPDELKLDIFRVVQEALSNVARHAQATEVRLSLTEQRSELRLSIEDDGRGFDPQLVLEMASGAIGLLTIRKRIRATGGTMALDSSAQSGTRIEARWAIGFGAGPSENGDRSYYPKRSARTPIRQ